MSQGEVLTVFRESILLMLKISAPLLLVSILIGLVVAVFQAATQIHEQTWTFVPKIIAIVLLLLLLGSWMLTQMEDLFHSLFSLMTQV